MATTYALVRSVFVGTLLTVRWPGPCPGQDQDRPTSPPTVDELARRLEQAEGRIRVLEAQSRAAAVLGNTIFPAPYETLAESASKTHADSNAGRIVAEQPRLIGGLTSDTIGHLSTIQADADTGFASSPPAEPPPASTQLVKVGGRIHIDGTLFPRSSAGIGFFENPSTGDDPDNRLEFRRLRLEVSGDVSPDMFYKLDFEFSDPNDPQILDAYLGFRNVPCFETVLIGNQTRPLGIEVLTSSNAMIFMENALVFGESSVDARRIGVLGRGYASDESVNWQIGAFELPNLQSSGQYVSDPFEGSINARVCAIPWYVDHSCGQDYILVGANTMFANPHGDAQFQTRPELRTQSRWIDTGTITGSNFFNSTGVEGVINVVRGLRAVSGRARLYIGLTRTPTCSFTADTSMWPIS